VSGFPLSWDSNFTTCSTPVVPWSARSGATLKELMSSTRAAMIYQHASRSRDEAIAAALDELIVEAGKQATE
jgi:hypothetical protein